MNESTGGVFGRARQLRRMAAAVTAALLCAAMPLNADPQAAASVPKAEPRPDLTTIEQFDSMLDQRNSLAWSVRENVSSPEFDIFGKPMSDYAEQHLFTPELEAALKALRAKAGAQAASGDQAGLADTLRQAQVMRDLETYRMGILYAFSQLSRGLEAHESALQAFLAKSPAAEQQATRARLEPMLEAAHRRLLELLAAPTLEEAKRGIEVEPVSVLPGVYNEERMRLAPFVAAWDTEHGIAPLSRIRSAPCNPPYPALSPTDTPTLEKSSVTQPDYPVDARRLGFAGTIHIRAEISETGCAKRVEIARSAGFQSLDAAALAWAEGLRFQPAQVRGRAKAGSYTFAVTFRLND